MSFSLRPNDQPRTNCVWCGKFIEQDHRCKRRDAAIEVAGKQAEGKFNSAREVAEMSREARERADANQRLNVELAKLAGMSPREYAAHQRKMDDLLRRFYERR